MLLKYITIASAINFLLLSFMLLIKKSPTQKANRIMGVFFLLMTIYSFLVSFRFTALVEQNYSALNYYIPVDGIFMLLMAPSLYFYILSILDKPPVFLQWKMLLHLIPTIPFIAFNLYFSNLTQAERIAWFIKDFSEGTLETNMLNVVHYIQIPIYLIISYLMVLKQLKVSPKVVIDNVAIDISWMKLFLIMNISFVTISAPLCFYFANEKANIIIGELAMNIQFLYIFSKSVWSNGIFSTEKIGRFKNSEPTLKIDNNLADDYLNTLTNFMISQKPFLKEDCNLQYISDQTGISIHQISNVLNSKLKKNFSDYINEYRIEESKLLLHSDHSERLTIEALGFECGFGSKSSFNKAFKKHTQLTPSQYRQKIKTEKL